MFLLLLCYSFYVERKTGLEPATCGLGSHRSAIELLPLFKSCVLRTGVEPARALRPPPPQSGASTNSATVACFLTYYL